MQTVMLSMTCLTTQLSIVFMVRWFGSCNQTAQPRKFCGLKCGGLIRSVFSDLKINPLRSKES